MKKSFPLLVSIVGTSVLAASVAAAQTQPPPAQQPEPPVQQTAPAAQTQPSPPGGNNMSSSNGGGVSATYNTAQGQVTINSVVPQAPSTASPPSFEQLANGKKFITQDDANAYPPLANDFLQASHHADRITKAQYERWLKSLN